MSKNLRPTSSPNLHVREIGSPEPQLISRKPVATLGQAQGFNSSMCNTAIEVVLTFSTTVFRPGGFPVTYTVSSSVKSPILPVITASDNLFTTSKIIEVDADALLIKEASGIKAAEQAAERMAQEFSSAMKTAKVSFLKGLVGKPSFLPLSVDLSTEDSTMTDFLPFQLVLLAHAEMEVKASATKQSLETVIAVADKCASLIDTTAIALNLGRLVNKDDDVAVKARKDIEAKKSELVNALFSKACALLQLRQYEEETSGPAFDICFNEMKKWDDLSGSRFAKIHLAILKDKKRFTQFES